MAVIYALSLDGVNHRYVGATGQKAARRLSSHRFYARTFRSGAPLYDWMRQVGPDNVVVSLLETFPDDVSKQQLGSREMAWIASLREEGYDLLNECDGVPGRSGVHPPEDIAKRAAAAVGKKRDPYNWKNLDSQKKSGAKAAHNRWHLARQIIKPGCAFCTVESTPHVAEPAEATS